jgi:hypothetical protein
MAAIRSLWRQSASCILRRYHATIQTINAPKLTVTVMIGISKPSAGIRFSCDMVTTSFSAEKCAQDPLDLQAVPRDQIADDRTDHGGWKRIVHRRFLARSFSGFTEVYTPGLLAEFQG